MAELLDSTLRDFLDSLAENGPAPGGGATAALVVAMSAGLVAMVARESQGYWDETGGVIGQAETFRARMAPLAQSNAEAYEEALDALRRREELEERYRDQQLRDALERAAEIPMQIAEAGCDLADLAAQLVERGNPEVRADAAVAAGLAEAGTRAAAKLGAINLVAAGGDGRAAQAEAFVERAAEAAQRALAAAD